MTPRTGALAAALAALGLAATGRAEDGCRALDARGREFVTCFDPGNRLFVGGSTEGLVAGLALRQRVATDDARVHYRLEHSLVRATLGAARYDVAAYSLRLVRHSDSGFLVLPTRPPKQLAIPFDLALEASALRAEGRHDDDRARVGVVRVALLADLARSDDGRLRVALGPATRWDATVDLSARAAADHDVAPFSLASASLYAESRDGLTLARAVAEGGASRDREGFHRAWRAEAEVERVFLGLNDHPLSVFLVARHDRESGASVELGLRFAALTRAR